MLANSYLLTTTLFFILVFLPGSKALGQIEPPADPFGRKPKPAKWKPRGYEYIPPPPIKVDLSNIRAAVKARMEKFRAKQIKERNRLRVQKAKALMSLKNENMEVQLEKIEPFLEAKGKGIKLSAKDIAATKEEKVSEAVISSLPVTDDLPMMKASDALLKYLELSMEGKASAESLREFVEKRVEPADEGSTDSDDDDSDDSAEADLLNVVKSAFVTPKTGSKEKAEETDEAFEKMLSLTKEAVDEVVVQGHSSTNAIVGALDKRGYSKAAIKAIQNANDWKDIHTRTTALYEKHGRDVSLGYLMFRTTSKLAEFIGGTFAAPVQTYAEVGAKMLETGTNVYKKAQVRSGYIEAGKGGTTANRILNERGKIDRNGASLDVSKADGTTTTLKIASWKAITVKGKKAYVPCDENFDPLPYVFIDKPTGLLGFFKKKEADVFVANVEKLDEGKISWDESERVVY